jgi:hypothetical protein
MKKITFTFPSYEALWQFKGTSSAINVSISPKHHKITGLFPHEEVNLAVSQFGAQVNNNEMALSSRQAV